MARSTAAETELRVKAVYGLLCDGKSRGEIVRFGADTWGLQSRMMDNLIARARDALAKDCELTRTAFLAECLAGIRQIRQKAESEHQHQTALNAIKLQAELTGLVQ